MEYRPFSGLSLSRLGMGDMRLPAVPGQEEKIDEGKTRLLKWRKTTQTGSTPAVFVWALALTSALLVSGCSSLAKAKEGTETPKDALMIAEQGNFSAGGAVISSDGEFDPKVPWFVPQGGQTRHGDHADVVNRHGGDVTIVHLPKIGIKGNTHFIMSDLNNQEFAGHLSAWLDQKGLK
jgi:hypothetical protein